MSETSTAPEPFTIMFGNLSHESIEGFDPCKMMGRLVLSSWFSLYVQKVDHVITILVLADVERCSQPIVVVVICKDVNCKVVLGELIELLLDCCNLFWCNWVRQLIEMVLNKILVIWMRPIHMMFCWMK